METRSRARLSLKLGSKRKGSSDEETEVKRKISRPSIQTCNDEAEDGLGVKNVSGENTFINTDEETQNRYLAYSPNETAIYIWKSKSVSSNAEGSKRKSEEEEQNISVENEVISADNEIKNSDLVHLPNESAIYKTEFSNVDSSITKPEEVAQHLQERDGTTALVVEGHTTAKVDEKELGATDTDDENSHTSTEHAEDETDIEREPDEYVYRILRFNETYHNGLRPKNLFSRISLQQHVERGSKGQESRYISCCKSTNGIQTLGRITNESSRVREVVRINITKLNNNIAQVIDLTKEETRERHIARGSTAWGYADKFEEVIIVPKSHVPPECVEKFGEIHERCFKLT